MTVRRAILLSLLLLLPSSVLNASTLVIRDSIGPDSSLTDGMPGGLTRHDGLDWNTPGLVVNVPEDGKLTEARFVVFARGPEPGFEPENNLANMYGYPMGFHIWSDGVEGGADSFDLNPQGLNVSGHTDIVVNSSTESFITLVPFGQTGPANEFTTFLLTVDLSSFNLVLESGNQYVMGLIQDNAANFITGSTSIFRISASRATGFEDVFRAFNTNPALRPGYVKSQLGNTFEQYAGAFTLTTFAPGDYDFDGDVDEDDFDKWRIEFGTTNFMSDGNDNGIVDAADYTVWRDNLGTMAGSGSLQSPTAVPEPNAMALCLMALLAGLRRPRR